MKIGVFGTGMVGNSIATKLIQLGHEVMMGSRTSDNEKGKTWVASAGAKASLGTYADVASFGELLFNCTSGGATMDVMKTAGEKNLNGKILIDIANPLDFSKGMPPSLYSNLSNTTSLAEEIQKSYPNLKVVKALNTMNCMLMVNPKLVPGDHDLFMCGNDEGAKSKVKEILASFGWNNPIDLGDLSGARGMEAILPLWIRLYGVNQSPNFNFKIVK